MSKKILVFVPIYNGERQITRTINKLLLVDYKYDFDVIIVNNKSTDNTKKKIINYFNKNSLKNHYKLIDNYKNYGLGGSHKIAYDYCLKNKYDYLIIAQGDDQGNPVELIEALNETINKNEEIDVIMGSRFKNLSKIRGYSYLKICFNLIFNIFASIILKTRISDLSSGQLILNTKILNKGFYKNFPNELWFNYYFFFILY